MRSTSENSKEVYRKRRNQQGIHLFTLHWFIPSHSINSILHSTFFKQQIHFFTPLFPSNRFISSHSTGPFLHTPPVHSFTLPWSFLHTPLIHSFTPLFSSNKFNSFNHDHQDNAISSISGFKVINFGHQDNATNGNVNFCLQQSILCSLLIKLLWIQRSFASITTK